MDYVAHNLLTRTHHLLSSIDNCRFSNPKKLLIRFRGVPLLPLQRILECRIHMVMVATPWA